jgi:uncharacterized integral membrane protein
MTDDDARRGQPPDGDAERRPDAGADRGSDADAGAASGPARDDPEAGTAEPTPPTPRPRERGRDAGEPAAVEPTRTPLTQQIGRATVIVLAVLFGVFAVANAHHVDFSWIFGGTEVVSDADGERLRGGVPLIILLLVAFAIGALVGALVTWQAGRAKRAQQRSAARQRKRGA